MSQMFVSHAFVPFQRFPSRCFLDAEFQKVNTCCTHTMFLRYISSHPQRTPTFFQNLLTWYIQHRYKIVSSNKQLQQCHSVFIYCLRIRNTHALLQSDSHDSLCDIQIGIQSGKCFSTRVRLLIFSNRRTTRQTRP